MAKAYGSITIVDIGDLGQLSVVPESNQPTMVVYDPDTKNYNPNWGSSALILTPIVYYGGKSVSLSDVEVAWKYKNGSGAATSVTDDIGINNNGILTISKNLFSNLSSSLLTFIVSVIYREPNTNIELEASGQITFGLIKNASKTKTITINGESVFLYNSENKVDKESLTLSARAENCSITNWQYKKSDNTYATIDEAKSNANCIIKSTDDFFVNDVAVIRVNTNIENLYDEHTITKIRAGANGTSTISLVLSNEDQMIACDNNGKPIPDDASAFALAETVITIYEGNTDDTSNWNIVATADQVVGDFKTDGVTYKVSKWQEQSKSLTGSVTFTCTHKTNGTVLTKKFSLTKITTGADGTSPIIYSIEPNTLVTNTTLNSSNEISGYTPEEIVLNAYQWNGAVRTAYNGRFSYKIDGGDLVELIPEEGDIDASTVTLKDLMSKKPTGKIEFFLYKAGSRNDLLDTQTVIVTSNGKKGSSGTAAVNFVFGNQMQVIPCDNSGKTKAKIDVNLPFTVFSGTSRKICKASITSGLISNEIVLKSNTNGSTSKEGSLVLTFEAEKLLGNSQTGEIKIQLGYYSSSSATSPTATKEFIFTWTKNIQAADGASAILFQLSAPYGNIINNGENSVTLQAILLDGATSVDLTEKKLVWSKYISGSYQQVAEQTGPEYVVEAGAVDGYASYRCTVIYGVNEQGQELTHTAYISVQDKDDPLQVNLVSTLGEKILNGQGKGIIYPRITRNGEEIDAPPTLEYGVNLPDQKTDSGFFYKMTPSVKNGDTITPGTVTLMKHNGSGWITATTNDYQSGYVCNWTLRDDYSSKNPTTINDSRVIYVDALIINNKMIFDVEVTKRAN